MLTGLRLWLLKELLYWYFERERREHGLELVPRFYFGKCPACGSSDLSLEWVKGF